MKALVEMNECIQISCEVISRYVKIWAGVRIRSVAGFCIVIFLHTSSLTSCILLKDNYSYCSDLPETRVSGCCVV